MLRIQILILLFSLCFVSKGFSQQPDTIKLTLQQAEARFLEKNLVVLANRANIDIAKAYTEQARLWDNPELNTNFNLYNGSIPRFFDPAQVYVQVQQLFKLGQKRRRLIELSQGNESLTDAQFKALVRELRFQLRSTYAALAVRQQKARTIELALNNVTDLAKVLQTQSDSGVVAKSDWIRVQAVAFGLQQDLLTLRNDMTGLQGDLRILIQAAPQSVIDLAPLSGAGNIAALDPLKLLETARQNRPDILVSNAQMAVSEQNWRYQKSLAVPDLTAGLEYDRASGFALYAINFQLGIQIPLFNRNQGNIHAARVQTDQAKLFQQQTVQQVDNQVITAYQQVKLLAPAVSGQADRKFLTAYSDLVQRMVGLFKLHQISLLEFTDWFGSWSDNQIKQLDTTDAYWKAAEELNYQVGQTVL
jgi:cobalt-zinc-cadmium efflux system outer membrane protein